MKVKKFILEKILQKLLMMRRPLIFKILPLNPCFLAFFKRFKKAKKYQYSR